MRYYFHISMKGVVIRDQEGTELSSVQDAKREAAAIATELRLNFPAQCDETGMILVRKEGGDFAFGSPIMSTAYAC